MLVVSLPLGLLPNATKFHPIMQIMERGNRHVSSIGEANSWLIGSDIYVSDKHVNE